MSCCIQALLFVYYHFEENFFYKKYQISHECAVKLWFLFGMQKCEYAPRFAKPPVQFYFSILQSVLLKYLLKIQFHGPLSVLLSQTLRVEVWCLHVKSITLLFLMLLKFEKHC